MKDDTFVNILLLGETGVGKSTFINSFVNYLTYGDFNKAKRGNLTTLIPSKCQIQDKYGEYHTIEIGSEYDANECLETGMSATQDVKSYVFPIWKDAEMKIRLIDTPGIGDVRGIEQDNINCDNIVRFIKHFKELHAICYLLKPTNSRITIYFDYCMTQILSRLEKSASKNIIFVFTNSRGTDYTPGDTLVNLEKIIDDIKNSQPNINIPLDKNVFCLDNEPFRCLAAIKNNVQFDRSVRQRNYESWKQSAKQCQESWLKPTPLQFDSLLLCRSLIKYIVGNEERQPLLPHIVETTYNINEVKSLIVLLSQPLAKISQLINENLLAVQRHEENTELESEMLNKLKQNFYTYITDLQIIKLKQNIIVCANAKCVEKYKVGDVHKTHYTQICQNYLNIDIPKNIIGCPELLSCSAIDLSTQRCKTCNCYFSTHICIDYKTVPIQSKLVDRTMRERVSDKEQLLLDMRKTKNNIDVQNGELERERDMILNTCTRFAHFLKNNVILSFSKSYKGYLEYLIMRDKSLGAASDKSVVEGLHKLLQEYEAAKQSFDKALSFGNVESDVPVTPYFIRNSLKYLCQLKHSGPQIKSLYNCLKEPGNIEYNYTEYVHETLLQIDQKRYHKERIYKSTNSNQFVQHQPQNQYRSSEHSQNQSYERNHVNTYNRDWGCVQNRGRGQWQHRSRGRNNSQTDLGSGSQSRTRDSESEDSQRSDCEERLISSESSESDQSEVSQSKEGYQQYRQFKSGGRKKDLWERHEYEIPSESVSRASSRSRYSENDQSEQRAYPRNQHFYRGRARGQWQHHSRRDNSQAPNRYNKWEQSQSPNRQYNQSYHHARSESRGRSHWEGRGEERDQSQNPLKTRERKDESSKSRSSSRSDGSESDQTEHSEQKDHQEMPTTYRGRGRNQRQNQGRTRGQWQHHSRSDNSQTYNRHNKREQSQSPNRQYNQSYHHARSESRGRGQRRGRGKWRDHSQNPSKTREQEDEIESRASPRSEDSESDQTENSEQKDQEGVPTSYRGRGRNQRQHQGRTRGQWQFRGRSNSRDERPNRESNQPHHPSGFQNRGRSQWRGQGRGGRGRNQFRSTNQNRDNNQAHTPDSPAAKETPGRAESDLLTQFSLGAYSIIPESRSQSQSLDQSQTVNKTLLGGTYNKDKPSSVTAKGSSQEKELPSQPRPAAHSGMINDQSQGVTQPLHTQNPIKSNASFAGPRTVTGSSVYPRTSHAGMPSPRPATYSNTSIGRTQNRARANVYSTTLNTGVHQTSSQSTATYSTTSNNRMYQSPSQNIYASARQPSKPIKKKEDCLLL